MITVQRIDTDDVLAAYLYRVEERDGYFYGSVRQVASRQSVELVGIATRYRGDQFRHAETLPEFRENVDRLAKDVYWFDDAIPTDGGIVEFLYRASWSDETYLYAATRQEVEVTSHELIGVVVRPPRQTVETTKWGRSRFEENVHEVATHVVWFEGGQGETPGIASTGTEHRGGGE